MSRQVVRYNRRSTQPCTTRTRTRLPKLCTSEFRRAPQSMRAGRARRAAVTSGEALRSYWLSGRVPGCFEGAFIGFRLERGCSSGLWRRVMTDALFDSPVEYIRTTECIEG